jgi:hypothetical protein
MSFETLNCNECGALLQVPAAARYATCNACGAHLVVQRTGVATYTEAPPAADPALRDMSERLEQLESQNELARIDREWQMEREQYMVASRYGRYVPSTVAAVVMGVFAVGFGLIWIVMGLGLTDNFNGGGVTWFMPLFGLVFIVFGLFLSISQFNRAQRYRTAQAKYGRRRAKALDDLRRMKE